MARCRGRIFILFRNIEGARRSRWLGGAAQTDGGGALKLLATTFAAIAGLLALCVPPAWAQTNRDWNMCRDGDPDTRIAACSRIIDGGSRLSAEDRAAAYNGRGLGYYAKFDRAAAARDFGEAIRLSPKDAAFYANRANAYFFGGKRDLAESDANEAIRLDPKNASAYSTRGHVRLSKNDLDDAVADFTESIRLDPKDDAPYNGRGSVRRMRGDLDGALADFSEAIRLNPRGVVWYGNRADVHSSKGYRDGAAAEFRDAIADYSEAIRLMPSYTALYNGRAFAYYNVGDLDKALADYNDAIRRDPKMQVAYGGRCRVRFDKGDYDGAIADCSKAVELDPKFPTAFTTRGRAYEQKNDLARAVADFKSALAVPEKYLTGKWAQETARARLQALEARQTVATSPAASKAPAERRIALVIGNSAYKSVAALPNPDRDADALAEVLRGIGFQDVRLEHDLAREKLIEVLRAFARDAANADWAVIYFAGHGLEMGGTNYVIPVDAKLETDRDVQYEAIPLGQIMGSVEGARRLRLVVLDACRDNPFVRQMTKSVASRSIGRGLANVEPEVGTLVAYAAKGGEVALDGNGDNSPFVSALLKSIPTPGLEIGKLFRNVRDDVLSATGGTQEPVVYGSLPGEDLFFVTAK
jgi:tetratricopeptide (TPR) repeat protein